MYKIIIVGAVNYLLNPLRIIIDQITLSRLIFSSDLSLHAFQTKA